MELSEGANRVAPGDYPTIPIRTPQSSRNGDCLPEVKMCKHKCVYSRNTKVNCFISLVSSYNLYHLLIGAYCTVVVVVAVRFFAIACFTNLHSNVTTACVHKLHNAIAAVHTVTGCYSDGRCSDK